MVCGCLDCLSGIHRWYVPDHGLPISCLCGSAHSRTLCSRDCFTLCQFESSSETSLGWLVMTCPPWFTLRHQTFQNHGSHLVDISEHLQVKGIMCLPFKWRGICPLGRLVQAGERWLFRAVVGAMRPVWDVSSWSCLEWYVVKGRPRLGGYVWSVSRGKGWTVAEICLL